MSQIHSSSDPQQWHHVKTTENPADSASRGVTADHLIRSSLWWPKWLAQQKIDYPIKTIDTTVEQRKVTTLVTSQENNQSSSILDKYSKLSTLVRVIAYCHRIVMKNKPKGKWLRSNELEIGTKTCIRITKNQYLYSEINQLKITEK